MLVRVGPETIGVPSPADLGRAIVLAVDGIGRITHWNAQAEQQLGWPTAEIGGRLLREVLFHQEGEPAERRDGIWEAFAAGAFWEGEILAWRKSGEPLPAWVTQSPKATEDGSPPGAVWVLVDLSEHHRAAASLRESEHTRSIFAHAGVGMAVRDLAGRFAQVNPALCALLGYPEAELLARDFQAVSHPEDLPAETALVGRVLDGELPSFTIQKRYVRKDGDVVWAETSVILVRDAQGHPKDMVALVQDVTSRQRAHTALRASEERYRMLVETARDMMITVDAEGLFTSFNTAFDSLTGWKATQWLGRPFSEILPPEDLARCQATFEAALRGEAPPSITHGMLAREGAWLTFETTAMPQLQDGRVAGVFGVSRDVTERKRMEEEREALLRRLVHLQEEERRAIARELHDEVGQLLTGLRLMIEHSDAAGVMERTEEMKRVVNELIGRVRGLSMNLRPPMLDELGVLPTLLWLIERSEKQAGLAVRFRHAHLDRRFPHEVELTAVRVVQEALNNAAKHAGVASVRVEVWASEDTLGARIEDEGRGFDVEAALRGHTSGLSGIRERCRLLKGRLEVESAPGTGTRLLVELPTRDSTDDGSRS